MSAATTIAEPLGLHPDITVTQPNSNTALGQAGIDAGRTAGQLVDAIGGTHGAKPLALTASRVAPEVGQHGAVSLARAVSFLRGSGRGRIVLGHFPDYVDVSRSTGAGRFDIGETLWGWLSDSNRWMLNREFLDAAARRGDDIILATHPEHVRAGSYLEREIQYLESIGYQFDRASSSMVRSER